MDRKHIPLQEALELIMALTGCSEAAAKRKLLETLGSGTVTARTTDSHQPVEPKDVKNRLVDVKWDQSKLGFE